MGAMLRFKQETGREITEMAPGSVADMCIYLWCCVVSASKREGKPFDMSLMDFADSLSQEDMEQWSEAVTAESDEEHDVAGEEKKSL